MVLSAFSEELVEKVFSAIDSVDSVARGTDTVKPPRIDGSFRASSGLDSLVGIYASREEYGIPRVDLPLFGNEGIRSSKREEDVLWGLLDQAPLELLVGLLSVKRPRVILVIGGGTGVVPLVCHKLLGQYGTVTSVDLGGKVPTFRLSERQEEYIFGSPHFFIDKSVETGRLNRYADFAQDADDPLWFNTDVIGLRAVTEDSYRFLSNHRGTFDFIVIDGSHDRDAVTADILLSWERLDEGGVLFVDDVGKATNSGVDTAVQILAVARGAHPYLVSEQDFAPKACFFIKGAQPWSLDPRVAELIRF